MRKISLMCNNFYQNGCHRDVDINIRPNSNLWLIVKLKFEFPETVVFNYINSTMEY
jgi:hypothetical protein